MKIPLNTEIDSPQILHQNTQRYRRFLQAFGYPMRVYELDIDVVYGVIACFLDSTTGAVLSNDSLKLEHEVLATGATISSQAEWFFATSTLVDLTDIPIGSREAPEDGAMVVIEIDAISESSGSLCVEATGAGLPAARRMFFSGLNEGVITDHIALHDSYPCGIDLLLCAGKKMVAIPRHLRLELL
ncbi:carbon-phosphorus lyase complex subunit [Oligella ureolytica]|uniref:Carbon-phosphorus lyase complex subunit n=1 Tax=Oligella ureolytica TaxID=90244 RepID=A0A378XJD7_9BURK|nr:phosphonate C-P lyase system protein PhnH [Oligella ureolytica]QPT39688.1 phosphonate C-P lyase system protein PhnH [Oligella ureolytica]SUA52428.1 carbon-phosphorus lyase complex subunit [Oligella ureolytica]SUA57197.1 carbon-phosphorus lyase complex subunit [Oligella ureolytica]